MKLIVLIAVVGLTVALVSGMPQQQQPEQQLDNEEILTPEEADDLETETGNKQSSDLHGSDGNLESSNSQFFKGARARGRTRDLFGFLFIFSL